MDKELLESYMNDIEEEMKMMRGKNITTQFLNYLDSLMCTYKKLEKAKNHDEYEKDKQSGYGNGMSDEIDGTYVDDNLRTAFDEYKAYIQYKNRYNETNQSTDLDRSNDELEHFLMDISNIFAEIEERSRDSMDERSMVKKYIKAMFQSFD